MAYEKKKKKKKLEEPVHMGSDDKSLQKCPTNLCKRIYRFIFSSQLLLLIIISPRHTCSIKIKGLSFKCIVS